MIVGRAIRPSTIDAASQELLNSCWSGKKTLSAGITSIMPTNPNTTEGMAENSSTTGFRVPLSFGLAISEMYTAQAIPTGTAMTMAPAVTMRVPAISGSAP